MSASEPQPTPKKRPSSTDVARLAGVSQATVSYVLSNRSDKVISEDTRERVLSAVNTLSYMPNRLANGILRGKTSTIGVIMSDFGHSFYSKLLMGLEEEFSAEDYHILIAHTRSDANFGAKQVRMLLEHRVDGMVVVADESTILGLPQWAEEAQRVGVQLCVIDDRIMEGTFDTIVSDDIAGSRLAVQHLIDLGHHNIAFLGGGGAATTAQDRFQGYAETLTDNGIPVRENYRIPMLFHEEHSRAELLLTLKPRPTAVLAISDAHAARTINDLRERKLKIPEEMAFIGYGNPEWADFLNLTSVFQNPLLMGRTTAGRLVKRIKGDTSAPMTLKLMPELVVRASTSGYDKQ